MSRGQKAWDVPEPPLPQRCPATNQFRRDPIRNQAPEPGNGSASASGCLTGTALIVIVSGRICRGVGVSIIRYGVRGHVDDGISLSDDIVHAANGVIVVASRVCERPPIRKAARVRVAGGAQVEAGEDFTFDTRRGSGRRVRIAIICHAVRGDADRGIGLWRCDRSQCRWRYCNCQLSR